MEEETGGIRFLPKKKQDKSNHRGDKKDMNVLLRIKSVEVVETNRK